MRQVLKISVSSMLMYRSNVFFFLVFETLFLVTNFLVADSGIKFAGGTIKGWTANDVFLLTAFNNLTHQIFVVFFIGALFGIPYDVATGKMDYTLLKPLRPLAGLFATHEFVISNFPSLTIALGAFIYFCSKADVTLGTYQVFIFIVLFFLACGIRFSLALMTLSPCFISEKLDDTQNTYWNISSLSRFPTSIYPRTLQFVFSSFIPLAVVSTVPCSVLLRKDLSIPLYISVIGSLFFIILAYFIFKFSLRHYKSVNAGIN